MCKIVLQLKTGRACRRRAWDGYEERNGDGCEEKDEDGCEENDGDGREEKDGDGCEEKDGDGCEEKDGDGCEKKDEDINKVVLFTCQKCEEDGLKQGNVGKGVLPVCMSCAQSYLAIKQCPYAEHQLGRQRRRTPRVCYAQAGMKGVWFHGNP